MKLPAAWLATANVVMTHTTSFQKPVSGLVSPWINVHVIVKNPTLTLESQLFGPVLLTAVKCGLLDIGLMVPSVPTAVR